jgi:hypothetical protein
LYQGACNQRQLPFPAADRIAWPVGKVGYSGGLHCLNGNLHVDFGGGCQYAQMRRAPHYNDVFDPERECGCETLRHISDPLRNLM